MRTLFVWIVAIVYAFRILRNNNQSVTKEQLWVFVMLSGTSLNVNPLAYFWWIHDFVILLPDFTQPNRDLLRFYLIFN